MNMRIQRHQKNVHETQHRPARIAYEWRSRNHVRTACYDSGENMSEQHVMIAEKAC